MIAGLDVFIVVGFAVLGPTVAFKVMRQIWRQI